jgi:hypothetical protein
VGPGVLHRVRTCFDESFFDAEPFRDLAHLTERAADFEAFHNARHRYSALGGKAPVDGRSVRRVTDNSSWPMEGVEVRTPLGSRTA